MSFIQSIKNRYTTKNYDSTKKVEPKKIEDLKEILRLSPSSINSQPWQFTFVSDEKTKQKLSEVSFHNTSKVIDCDTVVVFSRINNVDLFEKQIQAELPEPAINYYNQHIKNQPPESIKTWFEKQVYLALGVFLSACADMNIDATPMEGIEPSKYDEILESKEYSSIVAVAIGKRDAEDFNQLSKKPKSRRDLKLVVRSI